MDQYEGLWRKLEGIQMTKIGQNGAQHLPQEEAVACPHTQKVSQTKKI